MWKKHTLLGTYSGPFRYLFSLKFLSNSRTQALESQHLNLNFTIAACLLTSWMKDYASYKVLTSSCILICALLKCLFSLSFSVFLKLIFLKLGEILLHSTKANYFNQCLGKAFLYRKSWRKKDCLYLDDFSAFNYFPVVGHWWRTSTSCNNIGPLWVSQVPKPREGETNGDNLWRGGTNIGLHLSMHNLFSFALGKDFSRTI